MTDSANVELVRSIYADWERGDYSAADWADPEIEYVVADGPATRALDRPRMMAAAWREILSTSTDVRSEAQEYRELDDKRVLVLAHITGRGKASGLEASLTRGGANLFHLRNGEVTKLYALAIAAPAASRRARCACGTDGRV